MARKYPKFLWSDPTNIKSEGPFIIHTQRPRFIAKPHLDERRDLYHTSILEVWDESTLEVDVKKIEREIPRWFNESGRFQSNNPDDVVICGLSKLDFLKIKDDDFSVVEAQQVIRILFPIKTKVIFQGTHSYGLKHRLELISSHFGQLGKRKFCSNETIIKAFESEGFKLSWEGTNPNPRFNIRKTDLTRISRLFR
jgi:hypothetical protein